MSANVVSYSRSVVNDKCLGDIWRHWRLVASGVVSKSEFERTMPIFRSSCPSVLSWLQSRGAEMPLRCCSGTQMTVQPGLPKARQYALQEYCFRFNPFGAILRRPPGHTRDGACRYVFPCHMSHACNACGDAASLRQLAYVRCKGDGATRLGDGAAGHLVFCWHRWAQRRVCDLW